MRLAKAESQYPSSVVGRLWQVYWLFGKRRLVVKRRFYPLTSNFYYLKGANYA